MTYGRLATVCIVGMFTWLSSARATAQTPKWWHLKGGQIEDVLFLDSLTGFTAEDGGRIRFTIDGGLSWALASVPDDVKGELRGLYFLDADTGFVVGDDGVVLKSVPSTFGQQWTRINQLDPVYDNTSPTPKPARLWDINMINPLLGWTVGYDGAIEKTIDGGATWNKPTCSLPIEFSGTDPDDIYDVHFFNSTHGVICGDYGKVYLTDPNTPEPCWNAPTDLKNGLLCPPRDDNNLELWNLSFDDPTSIISNGWVVGGVGFNNGYIFRYTSGGGWGGTWEQKRCYHMDQLLPVGPEVCGLATQYGIAVLGTTDPTVIDVGYAAEVFTYEAGTTNYNPCEAVCAAPPPMPSGCPSADGRVWFRRDPPNPDPVTGATNYRPRGPLNDVAKKSSTKACIVGRFCRILLVDVGGTPVISDIPLNPSAPALPSPQLQLRLGDGDFINSTTGCIIGQGGMIKRTDDAGKNWTTKFYVCAPSGCADVDGDKDGNGLDFSDNTTYGVAVGSDKFVATSADSGVTWTQDTGLPGTGTPDLLAAAFVPGSNRAYVVGHSGYVAWKDLGSSSSWTMASVHDRPKLAGVSFATDTVGYVVGNSDGGGAVVYKTNDAGGSWVQLGINGTPPREFYDIETWGAGSAAIAVGSNGSVYEKVAISLTFSKQTLPMTVTADLLDVEDVGNSGNEIRICGHDGVVLFRDSSNAWSAPKSQSSDILFRLSFQSLTHAFGVGQQGVIIEYRP